MPRYVIKIKIAIPVAVGKCICQIHIMQKQMRIYGHWIELKLICCSGKQRLPARCPLHVAHVALHHFLLMFQCSCRAAWDAKKYATLLVAWQASDRRQTTRQTCHGNLWARRQLPINYVHVHGKTTASSVQQRERDGDKERKGERGREGDNDG